MFFSLQSRLASSGVVECSTVRRRNPPTQTSNLYVPLPGLGDYTLRDVQPGHHIPELFERGLRRFHPALPGAFPDTLKTAQPDRSGHGSVRGRLGPFALESNLLKKKQTNAKKSTNQHLKRRTNVSELPVILSGNLLLRRLVNTDNFVCFPPPPGQTCAALGRRGIFVGIRHSLPGGSILSFRKSTHQAFPPPKRSPNDPFRFEKKWALFPADLHDEVLVRAHRRRRALFDDLVRHPEVAFDALLLQNPDRSRVESLREHRKPLQLRVTRPDIGQQE